MQDEYENCTTRDRGRSYTLSEPDAEPLDERDYGALRWVILALLAIWAGVIGLIVWVS